VMAYEALRYYSKRDLTFRFVSNVDSTDFVEASATSRRRDALYHLVQDLHHLEHSQTHKVRATGSRARSAPMRRASLRRRLTNEKLVTTFGIDTKNMFGFWDWWRPLLHGLSDRTLHDARDWARTLRRTPRRLSRMDEHFALRAREELPC